MTAGPILKRILIGVAAATLLVFAVGLVLPRTWAVSRKATVEAPRERVHALCADLTEWTAWAPWLQEGPGLVVTPGDTVQGPGARLAWSTPDGSGTVAVTASDPQDGVAFTLAFPQRGLRADCLLAYAPAAGGATTVTWTMTGDAGWNVMDRYLGLMMDPVLGPLFADGLERLKLVAEDKAPDADEDPDARPDTLGS